MRTWERRRPKGAPIVSGGSGSELEEVNDLVLWRHLANAGQMDGLMREEPKQARKREIQLDEGKEVWEIKELSL